MRDIGNLNRRKVLELIATGGGTMLLMNNTATASHNSKYTNGLNKDIDVKIHNYSDTNHELRLAIENAESSVDPIVYEESINVNANERLGRKSLLPRGRQSKIRVQFDDSDERSDTVSPPRNSLINYTMQFILKEDQFDAYLTHQDSIRGRSR